MITDNTSNDTIDHTEDDIIDHTTEHVPAYLHQDLSSADPEAHCLLNNPEIDKNFPIEISDVDFLFFLLLGILFIKTKQKGMMNSRFFCILGPHPPTPSTSLCLLAFIEPPNLDELLLCQATIPILVKTLKYFHCSSCCIFFRLALQIFTCEHVY